MTTTSASGTAASDPVRLTDFSHGAGCACKLSPADLRTVLGLMRGSDAARDPDLVVGFDTSDDAAVYRLRDDLALVFTTDFFTPIVDDPYDWGRIAATNALSDVYAMGAAPILALNLVGWPREGLAFDLLARVLDGGGDVVRSAGALIGGGHSIDDAEPKYGLAVIGTVHPDSVLTNAGARVGDALDAHQADRARGRLHRGEARGGAGPPRRRSRASDDNPQRGARDAAIELDAAIHAATDVTGFGLLGHLHELAAASGVAAEVDAAAVPVIDGVPALVTSGMIAGGTQRNHAFVSETAPVDWGTRSLDDQLLLCDAQTSGGLLLAVAPDHADELAGALARHGALAAAVVGHCVEGPPGALAV